MDKLPTFYIPHGGGPCFFMDWNPAGIWDGMARYLASFADDYRSDIKAIIVISAHWESQTIKVTCSRQPDKKEVIKKPVKTHNLLGQMTC